MILSADYNKLGCYRVGDAVFYSKLQAIEAMQRTGTHLHWDFNEAVYNSYDWTKEPETNILELYRRRAQQLRDQYDYIILNYSGGADSQTVLEAFVDNDIKLDEVVSHVNYQATGDASNFLNSEAFRVAIPQIKQVQERCPDLQHRILDMTDLTVDYFSGSEPRFDWIYEMNMFFTPNCVARESLVMKIPEWRDRVDRGQRVCMLWGHDKPRILHINGKFVFRFIDLIDSAATVKSLSGQQPYTDELFFWSPDLPEIVIKQAHMIRRYLQGNVAELPFVSTEKSDLAYREVNGVKYWLNNHGVHSVIYPRWNIETFSAGKSPSIVFSPRDEWFFSVESTNTIKHNWQIGLEKLWQTVPDYWKNNPTSAHAGFKACWSCDYYLE